MWILLSHFITLTWLFRISSCKPNFTAVFPFSYVCVLPSSNRAFMIRLLLPFSTMIGTVCNEIHPSFWYSVTINDIFCCCSPSMRIFWIDILDSALIHLPGWHCVTLYCAFFSNNHLCCKFIPNCILQLCDLTKNFVNYQILLVSGLIPPSRLPFVNVVLHTFFLIFPWQFDKLQLSA